MSCETPISTSGFHIRCNINRASSSLNLMKALSGSNSGFVTERLVGTCKFIVCLILNHSALTRYFQVFSSHLNNLEIVQNKTLKNATSCHRKIVTSHLRDRGIPESSSTQLCSSLLANDLHTSHPSHILVTIPPSWRSTPLPNPPWFEGHWNWPLRLLHYLSGSS